jgi:hypothetical protein
MIAASLALFALGAWMIFELDGRSWMAPTLLSVVLVSRAVWELYQVDGALAGATVASFALGGIGFGCWSNLDEAPDLFVRMWVALTLGALAALVALWRALRVLRADGRSDRA